jgi:predicted Zn-dependent protease
VERPPLSFPVEADLTPPPPPPQTPEDAEREARALLEKGFRQRAVQVLEDALDRHPEAPGVGRLLALTRGRESGFDTGVEGLLLSRLEKAPQDAELRYALASYYRRAGMAARAILQLRLVLSADSGHAAAWRDLGELEAGETRRR